MAPSRRVSIWIALLLFVLIRRVDGVGLDAGSIDLPPIATNRLTTVSLDPPAGATQVRLSADPGFRQGTNGVAVRITNLHTNLDYADVEIIYPGGKQGGRGFPGGLPEGRRDLRILVIAARLSDGGEFPAFCTISWLNEMMFGPKGSGAREVPNSVKAYWEQTSYGRVQISGAVFPHYVTLGATTNYVDLDPIGNTPTIMVHEAVAKIQEVAPEFPIRGVYDFVLLLLPGDLSAVYNSTYEQTSSVWSDPEGNFKGYLVMDLPVDRMSKYYGPIFGEKSVSIDETHVQTSYMKQHVLGVWLASDPERKGTNYVLRKDLGWFENPITLDIPLPQPNSEVLVDYATSFLQETNTSIDATRLDTLNSVTWVWGVWLANDTNRTGTNFFTGGTFTHRDNHITLGTPLPAPRTPVMIHYSGGALYTVLDPAAPIGSVPHLGSWWGTLIHELAHGFGPHITFTPTAYLGDLYQNTDEIKQFGLMSGGNHVASNGAFDVLWEDPVHLDGYTKYALGLLLPYELRFCENETNLRIYATEEYPYSSRTKLVKVPLHPEGRRGRRRLLSSDFCGEEYLLLELRKKGPVAGMHNFDSGLQHEGLLIYHVIEREPLTVGAFWNNVVRIIDATPAVPEDWFFTLPRVQREEQSFYHTSVPFGKDAGVYSYVHGESWQDIGNGTLPFVLEKIGPQKVYAQFRDDSTNESPVIFVQVNYEEGGQDENRNGIADGWERHYFEDAEVFADADPDRDGFNNLQEYLTGTHPLEPRSFAQISIELVGTPFLSYTGIPNTLCNAEFAVSLERPRWYPLSTRDTYVPETGLLFWYDTAVNSVPRRFYRVRLDGD